MLVKLVLECHRLLTNYLASSIILLVIGEKHMKMKQALALNLLFVIGISCTSCQSSDIINISINDTNDVLLNPGKGFVYYGGSSETSKLVNYIYSIGYHRFNWCDLETSDGVYNFEKIDKQISYYESVNKPFSFGVMCSNTSSDKEYITPKFVFDNGAKYDLSIDDEGHKQYIPNWQDEIFLDELKQFVKVLGERYNNHKSIAFIDILSYGNWGEQHLFGFHIDKENYEYDERTEPSFIKENYIKPYMDAFPDTLLVNPWGYEELDPMYEELIDQGVSIRRDGICKYTNGLDTLAYAYGKLPVIFEYAGNYKDNIKEGSEKEFNQMLKEAMDIAKPSYIELDIDWYLNNTKYCESLANKMGYYFRLKKVSFHQNLYQDGTINLTFKNDGLTPIYNNCVVYIGLLDENNQEVSRFKTNLQPKNWLPNEVKDEQVVIDFTNVKEGTYKLALGLFVNDTDLYPSYLLGSEIKLSNKWHILSEITLNS